VSQTVLGFDLDRDSQVQGSNDRDLKFRIHFIEPLVEIWGGLQAHLTISENP
jgi:hypothetical protein